MAASVVEELLGFAADQAMEKCADAIFGQIGTPDPNAEVLRQLDEIKLEVHAMQQELGHLADLVAAVDRATEVTDAFNRVLDLNDNIAEAIRTGNTVDLTNRIASIGQGTATLWDDLEHMKRGLTESGDALIGPPILNIFLEQWWGYLQDPGNSNYNVAQFYDDSTAWLNRFVLIDRMGTIFAMAYLYSLPGAFNRTLEINDYLAASQKRVQSYRQVFSDRTDSAPVYKVLVEELDRQRTLGLPATYWNIPASAGAMSATGYSMDENPPTGQTTVTFDALSPGDCRQEWAFHYVPATGRWIVLGFDSGRVDQASSTGYSGLRLPGQVASRLDGPAEDPHVMFTPGNVPTVYCPDYKLIPTTPTSADMSSLKLVGTVPTLSAAVPQPMITALAWVILHDRATTWATTDATNSYLFKLTNSTDDLVLIPVIPPYLNYLGPGFVSTERTNFAIGPQGRVACVESACLPGGSTIAGGRSTDDDGGAVSVFAFNVWQWPDLARASDKDAALRAAKIFDPSSGQMKLADGCGATFTDVLCIATSSRNQGTNGTWGCVLDPSEAYTLGSQPSDNVTGGWPTNPDQEVQCSSARLFASWSISNGAHAEFEVVVMSA